MKKEEVEFPRIKYLIDNTKWNQYPNNDISNKEIIEEIIYFCNEYNFSKIIDYTLKNLPEKQFNSLNDNHWFLIANTYNKEIKFIENLLNIQPLFFTEKNYIENLYGSLIQQNDKRAINYFKSQNIQFPINSELLVNNIINSKSKNSNQKIEWINYLKNKGYNFKSNLNKEGFNLGQSCVLSSISSLELELLKYFQLEIKEKFNTAFLQACKSENIEIVQWLIDYGYDCTFNNSEAIIYPSKENHLNLVLLLLENGCNINVAKQHGNENLNLIVNKYTLRKKISNNLQFKNCKTKNIKI